MDYLATSNFPSFFSRFKQNPWATIDSVDLNFHGFQFNVLRNDVKLRSVFFSIERFRGIPYPSGLIVFALILWVITGWDSSVTQIDSFMVNLPRFLSGEIDWGRLVQYYLEPYGKFMHWSAFVIYGLFFYGISKHLRDKLDVVNSMNIALTIGLTVIPIGAFETFWMLSYFFFQGQTWILSFQWPQLRIIIQNVFAMFFVGGLTLVAVDWRKVKLNLNFYGYVFFLATILSINIWWFYGDYFPVQQIVVQVEGFGTWVSSPRFAQTVYTIDCDLTDGLAMGTQYWIQNDLLHAVNVLCKVFMTFFFYNLFKLKRKNPNQVNKNQVDVRRKVTF